MPEKSNQTKITDSKKAWNRKKATSRYKLGSIKQNKVILVVCEGQTEKCYFESFPVLGLRIKIMNLGGQSKLRLVESAISAYKSSKIRYDQVWCVFDMDLQQGKKEYADYDNAIKKARSLGHQVAYSNDCFELWFCLHFAAIDTKEIRKFYYGVLSQKLGINYERQGKEKRFCKKIYQLLQDHRDASNDLAMKRAEMLLNRQKHLPFHKQNPATTVHQLVRLLNDNLRH